LTLTSALQYDHLGARDLDGVLDFLPHVGNLTRNVVIRSESATGTRGHVLATHMANVDVRYALFKDLGRTTYQPLNTTTNLIGRYPVHMHHLAGPMTTPANGFQFTLLGNAVDGGSVETKFKWGIAIHDSHYGSIQDNVVGDADRLHPRPGGQAPGRAAHRRRWPVRRHPLGDLRPSADVHGVPEHRREGS